MSSSWFEQLEAQLERQLETFLQANPAQEALVQEQEQQERQQRLKRQRLDLQAQAEHTRAGLLQLASDIAQWQQRLQRAQAAGATDLAQRAEAHVHQLMAQGFPLPGRLMTHRHWIGPALAGEQPGFRELFGQGLQIEGG